MKKLILLSLLLSACTANGPVFNESDLSNSKDATVIIYKKTAYWGKDAADYKIEINGNSVCDLHTGSFYIANNLIKSVTIASSTWDTPGTSRINFEVKPNNIYYVRVDANSTKQGAAAIGGFIGSLIAEGSSSESGPFIFTLIEGTQAKQELRTLKQDCL